MRRIFEFHFFTSSTIFRLRMIVVSKMKTLHPSYPVSRCAIDAVIHFSSRLPHDALSCNDLRFLICVCNKTCQPISDLFKGPTSRKTTGPRLEKEIERERARGGARELIFYFQPKETFQNKKQETQSQTDSFIFQNSQLPISIASVTARIHSFLCGRR